MTLPESVRGEGPATYGKSRDHCLCAAAETIEKPNSLALSSGSRKMMPTYAVLTADQDMLRENVRIAPPEWGLDLAEDE